MEVLQGRHAIIVDRETVRKWMIDDGLWLCPKHANATRWMFFGVNMTRRKMNGTRPASRFGGEAGVLDLQGTD